MSATIDAPNEAVQHPYQPQHPSHRRVSPQEMPVEDEIEVEAMSGGQCREQNEDDGADVVRGLEQDDLAEDPQRCQVRERAGSRWSPSSWHRRFMVLHELVGGCINLPCWIGDECRLTV